MGDSIYGYSTTKLTAIAELLDEARAELRSLKADPIEIIPTIVENNFKPEILINHDGSFTLALESSLGENNDISYDLDDHIRASISEADSENLENIIVYLSQLLAMAASQRASL